ncbi:MAG: thioredoxin [Elusimicrobiota bacterium]
MAEVILTEQNFKQEVLDAGGVVLVDFWAEWCGPCRTMGPVISELAVEFEGKAKICKLNVEENQKLSGDYSVMAIPTLLIFKGGKQVDRLVGAQSKQALANKINQYLR